MSKQLQTLRRRMEAHPDGKEQYESEAATLELTLDALKEKQEEYQDYLSDLAEQYCAYWNNAAAEQQADAAEDYKERPVGKHRSRLLLPGEGRSGKTGRE